MQEGQLLTAEQMSHGALSQVRKLKYHVGPGWGPVRVGARSGLGPIWAHMGPILLKN